MAIQTIDQLGQTLVLPDFPKRIVSLVPSQTEYLFDLGLDEKIVGITRFCVHPKKMVTSVEKIGGTKQLYFDKIAALQPDLIIANKEENNREDIWQLQQKFPVWISDVNSLADALAMMQEIGRITNREKNASEIIAAIQHGFGALSNIVKSPKTYAYFIWRKPYMVAANDTFIHQMLTAFGLRNVFEQQSRYPEVTAKELSALTPDYVFLSSEPYAFSNRHIEEFEEMMPKAKVIIVDGEMFSWYGSRLRFLPSYFASLQLV
jgi:ABC-type Fe3+-hydroxamate transport system substrate-binding protein